MTTFKTVTVMDKLLDVKKRCFWKIIYFSWHLCSFEELLKEERTCWQEICAFEKKIDAWSFSLKKDSEFPRLCLDRKGNEDLPAEVTALEIFLQQNGGQLGGWDQYDHQSFLKVWTKHGGKPPYRSEVKLYLPDKTEEDIRLHEAWYLELRHLQEKKKEVFNYFPSPGMGTCSTASCR